MIEKATLEQRRKHRVLLEGLRCIRFKFSAISEADDKDGFRHEKAETDENHPDIMILTDFHYTPSTNQAMNDEKHSH